MGGGGDAGASAEDDLRGHELAVVLAEGSGEGFVTGVAGVAACRPLPYVAEELLEAGCGGGGDGVQVAGFEEVGFDGRGVGGRCLCNFERNAGILPLRLAPLAQGQNDG